MGFACNVLPNAIIMPRCYFKLLKLKTLVSSLSKLKFNLLKVKTLVLSLSKLKFNLLKVKTLVYFKLLKVKTSI